MKNAPMMFKYSRSHAARHRDGEAGSALIYILIAIALLAALTVSFMQPSGNQTQTNHAFKTVSELQSQIDFIRSAVQECVLSHPGGDKSMHAGGTPTEPDADHRYPIDPTSAHFVGSTLGQETAGDNFVRLLRCPGNPGGDTNNHERLFGGTTAKFMPPSPKLFNDWRWYNSTDGVFFWIDTQNSDAFIGSALDKLREEFSACEADIITPSDATRTLAGGGVNCAANSYCFRVWMIRKTACP